MTEQKRVAPSSISKTRTAKFANRTENKAKRPSTPPPSPSKQAKGPHKDRPAQPERPLTLTTNTNRNNRVLDCSRYMNFAPPTSRTPPFLHTTNTRSRDTKFCPPVRKESRRYFCRVVSKHNEKKEKTYCRVFTCSQVLFVGYGILNYLCFHTRVRINLSNSSLLCTYSEAKKGASEDFKSTEGKKGK